MAARAGAGDLRCPELVMAGCRRSGSTYLRDIRGGEVRPTRRPAARPGRAAGRFPCLVVEPRRRGDPEPYGRLPIRGVARLGVVDEVAGDGQLGVVAHGDLLLWVGAGDKPAFGALAARRVAGLPATALSAAACRRRLRVKGKRRKVSGHRSGLQGDGEFSGPLTLRGDAPNGGECAMGPPEVVYQGSWPPRP